MAKPNNVELEAFKGLYDRRSQDADLRLNVSCSNGKLTILVHSFVIKKRTPCLLDKAEVVKENEYKFEVNERVDIVELMVKWAYGLGMPDINETVNIEEEMLTLLHLMGAADKYEIDGMVEDATASFKILISHLWHYKQCMHFLRELGHELSEAGLMEEMTQRVEDLVEEQLRSQRIE